MKKKIRITKQFNFETAHALYGYDGLCKNVHGHSYKLDVTVIGNPIDDKNHKKNGMLIDFSELKKIVKKKIVSVFDHSIILNVTSPHKDLADNLEEKGHKVVRVNYQPTCELMILDFSKIISNELPSNIKLYSLKLRETETSYSEWYAEDNCDSEEELVNIENLLKDLPTENDQSTEKISENLETSILEKIKLN